MRQYVRTQEPGGETEMGKPCFIQTDEFPTKVLPDPRNEREGAR